MLQAAGLGFRLHPQNDRNHRSRPYSFRSLLAASRRPSQRHSGTGSYKNRRLSMSCNADESVCRDVAVLAVHLDLAMRI